MKKHKHNAKKPIDKKRDKYQNVNGNYVKSTVERKPVEEVKQIVEVKPVEEVKPVVEAKSVEEVKPVVEAKSVEEVKPVVEAKSVEEVKPVVEEKTLAQEKTKKVVSEQKRKETNRSSNKADFGEKTEKRKKKKEYIDEDFTDSGKHITVKDVLVIVFSIVAVGVLGFILYSAKEKEKLQTEQLNDYQSILVNSGQMILASTEAYSSLEITECNQAGWLELYNTSRDVINIAGLSVCVNGSKVYTIPDETMVEGKNICLIDFKKALPASTEVQISLLNKEGEKITSMYLEHGLSKDQSYGRLSEEEFAMGILSPTKGETNANATVSSTKGLSFSVPSGFYTSEFSLSLTADNGCKIYYTLDGTQPDQNSEEYSAPITIKNRSGSKYEYAKMDGCSNPVKGLDIGTIVRAIAVDASGAVVEEKTQSYFVGIGKNANMSNYSVISIVTNPENLFSYFDGIYVAGRAMEDSIAIGTTDGIRNNFDKGYKKEAYVEYFEKSKNLSYTNDVIISMLCDGSQYKEQKGFCIDTTKSCLDSSGIKNFFNNHGENQYRILLGNSQTDVGYKIRHSFLEAQMKDTTVGVAEEEFCVVFIDGEYWGLYKLQKEYNQEYIESRYGISQGNEVVFANEDVCSDFDEQNLYNQMYNFVIYNNMKLEANYEKLQEYIDVNNYAEYICANMFIGNVYFEEDNATMWRVKTPGTSKYEDGKWRWLMGNCDVSMENGMSEAKTTVSIDSFLFPGFRENLFLQSILQNDSFVELLETTMTRMIKEQFDLESATEFLQNFAKENEKGIISSHSRFYGYETENFLTSEVEKMISFFENRPEYISVYIKELKKQRRTVQQIQKDSASGTSTGLEYDPASYLDEEGAAEMEQNMNPEGNVVGGNVPTSKEAKTVNENNQNISQNAGTNNQNVTGATGQSGAGAAGQNGAGATGQSGAGATGQNGAGATGQNGAGAAGQNNGTVTEHASNNTINQNNGSTSEQNAGATTEQKKEDSTPSVAPPVEQQGEAAN